jgi:hypothetical protein
MKTQSVVHTIHLTPMTCPVCGVVYGLSEEFRQRAQDAGERKWGWYCTNGHSLAYPGKSADDLERERLADELARTKTSLLNERDIRETVERSRAAIKGELTKTKKRVAKGVCPCCNRHFANVQRHMEGQHPDYIDSPDP